MMVWLSDHRYAICAYLEFQLQDVLLLEYDLALQPGEFQTRLTFPAVTVMQLTRLLLQIVRYASLLLEKKNPETKVFLIYARTNPTVLDESYIHIFDVYLVF
jgi:hypothetical protein